MTWILLVSLSIGAAFWATGRRGLLASRRCNGRRRRAAGARTGVSSHYLHPPKPAWVHEEVVRLKALMPDHGCRAVADVFNHLHRERRKMTVGKTFVAGVLRRRQLDVVRKRRELKHRRPRPMPRNAIWGLDLTYVAASGESVPVLGLVDHGTRASLGLEVLRRKTTVALLRIMLDVVERFGPPRASRTDSEACLTSWLFRTALRLLDIRHQRTAVMAPWQNGRVERFFGTFKERAAAWLRGMRREEIQGEIGVFRCWYNGVRPHRHLDGLRPAEVWNGVRQSRGRGPWCFFDAWEGRLRGFYRRP